MSATNNIRTNERKAAPKYVCVCATQNKSRGGSCENTTSKQTNRKIYGKERRRNLYPYIFQNGFKSACLVLSFSACLAFQARKVSDAFSETATRPIQSWQLHAPSDTCLSHPRNRHSHRPSRWGASWRAPDQLYMSAAAVVCAAADAAGASPSLALPPTIYVKALAAAQRNDIKALTEIWEKHGSRIFAEPLPEESGHILHYAAKGLRVKSVIWLLEHGADVNAIDREGEVRVYSVLFVSYLRSIPSFLGIVMPQPPLTHLSPAPTLHTDPSLLVRHHRLLLRPYTTTYSALPCSYPTHRPPFAGAPPSPPFPSVQRSFSSSWSTQVPTPIGKISMATPLSHMPWCVARSMPPVELVFKRCWSLAPTRGCAIMMESNQWIT